MLRSALFRITAILLSGLLVAAAVPAATQLRPDAELRDELREAIASAESFQDRFEAEVWLLDMAGRLSPWDEIPRRERMEILRIAHQEASRVELPPELVLAVIQIESNFDRFAISHAGARGLMQVMPFWLDELGRPEDNLFHIRTNIRYGCTILKHYLERERGDMQKALARYNGSVGKSWYPRRVFNALSRRWYRN